MSWGDAGRRGSRVLARSRVWAGLWVRAPREGTPVSGRTWRGQRRGSRGRRASLTSVNFS